MKMKQLSTVVLLAVVFASTGFSETIANWQGAPAGDANCPAGTGSWAGAYWNSPPAKIVAPPNYPSNEIKITKPQKVCIVDCNAGNYMCRLSISGGPDVATAPKLEIVKGGYLGIGEFRVGAGGTAKTGTIGCVNQTGGTLSLSDDLKIGRASTSENNPNNGKGFYTISGGTIRPSATAPRASLLVGGNGSGETPSEGTFTVVGKGASISVKKLYVGNDGYKGAGVGTLEFQLDANGASPIQVEGNIYLDQGGEATTTKLVVSAIGAPPKADILLAENQGNGTVNGIFDTVNGNPAAEGAEVVVNCAAGKYYYKLTYTGGTGGNDIMLQFARQEAAAAPATATPAATAAPAEPNK
jgi:hypothetical protein